MDPLIECPPGAKYADVIEFRTVALAGGMPARQDLIRLSAFNQHDQFLPQVNQNFFYFGAGGGGVLRFLLKKS